MNRILNSILRATLLAMGCVLLVTGCANQKGVEKAEKMWEEYRPAKIQNLGSTRTLAILPLIDYYTVSPELKSEPGVSYLIKTDHNAILFDVGFNHIHTNTTTRNIRYFFGC